ALVHGRVLVQQALVELHVLVAVADVLHPLVGDVPGGGLELVQREREGFRLAAHDTTSRGTSGTTVERSGITPVRPDRPHPSSIRAMMAVCQPPPVFRNARHRSPR